MQKEENIVIINNILGRSEAGMKKGFTLAEDLITLGIIGVVAAMTMPTVLSNYRKSQVVNNLKKDVAIFSQAIQMAEAKHGFMSDWELCENTNDPQCTKDFFEKYFEPELKIIKKCIPASEECWTRQKSLSGNLGDFTSKEIAGVLSNGTSFRFWLGNELNDAGKTVQHINIYIDIDGPKKGLATIGGDIFNIVIGWDDSLTVQKGVNLRGINRNTPFREDIINHAQHGCSKDIANTHTGLFCGGLIQHDGWKIPDDYPIKF